MINNQFLMQCTDLRFRYPNLTLPDNRQWLLDIENLVIKSGVVYSLYGENMSGKSTLVKLITGILPRFPKNYLNGTISFNNSLSNLPANVGTMGKNGISVVHQSDAMFPALSIWENLSLGNYNQFFMPSNTKERMEFIKKIIKEFDGSEKITYDKLLGELSGGTRTLCRLLRAIVWGYKILFLDEPTIHLDKQNHDKFYEILKTNWQNNSAIVLISHNPIDHDKIQEIATNKNYEYKKFRLEGGRIINL